MAYEKVKATASITIVDETDASTLTGNMLVVKGSKNQIYISGQANPFSPNWSKSNLVIRPFLQASNVTKENSLSIEYNPDLFDPKEYPESILNYGYIKDIHWYLRDSSGAETELYESSDFSFVYTYNIEGKSYKCNDHRQIVITNNILTKNSTADIICRFSFYDPFANIYVSQQLETNLINIASGQSNSRLVTTCINGTAITNNSEQFIDIAARFYGEEGEEEIDTNISLGDQNVSCLWYIRRYDGWVLLDPRKVGQDAANANGTMMYQMKRIAGYENETGVYTLEDYNSERGCAAIRIYPALITGSEVIKCVYTDYTGSKFNSVEIVYDTTDDTKIELYCNNGKRLRKGIIDNTTIKAVITYKGEVLEEDSKLYDTEFDYYWYKYTIANDKYVNVYNNSENDLIENMDLQNPIKGGRTLYVDTFDISPEEGEAKFTLDLLEYGALAKENAQQAYYNAAITEEDLGIAIAANYKIGIEDDLEAAMFTAHELNSLE
jgi:hypothetical protein